MNLSTKNIACKLFMLLICFMILLFCGLYFSSYFPSYSSRTGTLCFLLVSHMCVNKYFHSHSYISFIRESVKLSVFFKNKKYFFKIGSCSWKRFMESTCFQTRNELIIVIWSCKIYSINTSEFVSTVQLENFILKENVINFYSVYRDSNAVENIQNIQKKEEIIS